MIRFGYKAFDASGKVIEGQIVSETRATALEALRRRGEIPVEIDTDYQPHPQPWWQREVFGSTTLSLSGLAIFVRELATLVKAELPVDEALRIVALQPLVSARLRNTIKLVLGQVVEGQSLSQSLAAQGATFPEYIWQLVAAGEASGKLGGVLDDLAGFLERSAEVRAKIVSALIYPAVLLLAATIAIGVIVAVLLPAIVPLLRDAGASLPPIISILHNAGNVFAANRSISFIAIGTLCALLFAATKSRTISQVLSRFVLWIPLIGGLVTARETARFARTLATLMKSGVPMLDAIRISGSVLRNHSFQDAVRTIHDEIKQGGALARSLTTTGLFPDICLRLTAVGEQTGQLEAMLIRVADIFEATLQRQLERMMSLLTPILTLVIGLLVGWLIVSVMGALLSINQLVLG